MYTFRSSFPRDQVTSAVNKEIIKVLKVLKVKKQCDGDYGNFFKDGFAKELYLHKTTFIHEMKFKTLRILKINVNKN